MSSGKFHLASRKELLLILVLLGTSIAGALWLKFGSENEGGCAVIRCKDTVYRVDLSEQGEFTLEECGLTVFEIADGAIRIKSAACKDKICVNTGFIGNRGQCIVCVPQEITVTVESGISEKNNTDIAIG